MDFSLSPEQVSLRDAARGWIAARWSPERMRQALDRPPAEIPEGLWREVAAMGWVGIAVAEDCGGSGAGTVTAAVLAEEAGRGLLPGPLLSALAAAAVVERGGDAAQRKALRPDLCAGGCRVTVAVEEPGATWGRDPVGVRARRDADGDGWILDGTKILVPDAEAADTVLVSVATAEGAGVFAVPAHAPGVAVTPMRRLDAQSIAEVRLDGVVLPAGAALAGDRGSLGSGLDAYTVLGAADLLGVAEWALTTTTAYAKERVQFERPIGSFQAVSHRLADVCVAVEIGRGLVYGAALALDEGRPDAPVLVSAAKAWTSDAAVAATEAALHLHGGIGFTWELDVHLYLRRARAGAVSQGTADVHRDRIADHLERVRTEEGES